MHASHRQRFVGLFFFNDTATTEIYTLSLHDALPIYLRPGERLLEAKLSKELGVSQATVNAALQDLHNQGLVKKNLNRSTNVSKYTLKDIENLFAVRMLLEPAEVARVPHQRPGKMGHRRLYLPSGNLPSERKPVLDAGKSGDCSRPFCLYPVRSSGSAPHGLSLHGGGPRGCASGDHRSEERRVGKECRSRWSP